MVLYQIVWRRATANHPEGSPVGYFKGQYFKTKDEAYRALSKFTAGTGDITVEAVAGTQGALGQILGGRKPEW